MQCETWVSRQPHGNNDSGPSKTLLSKMSGIEGMDITWWGLQPSSNWNPPPVSMCKKAYISEGTNTGQLFGIYFLGGLSWFPPDCWLLLGNYVEVIGTSKKSESGWFWTVKTLQGTTAFQAGPLWSLRILTVLAPIIPWIRHWKYQCFVGRCLVPWSGVCCGAAWISERFKAGII